MANQYQSDLTDQRKAALRVLRRGLATVAEIAAHYGLARQTVQRWADMEPDLDVAAARQASVASDLARWTRPPESRKPRPARGPGSRRTRQIKPL